MKFRFQVAAKDFDATLKSNVESLVNDYSSLSFEAFDKLCNEVEDTANMFVHGNHVLKPGGDVDLDSDWVDDGSHSWLLIEIDTVTKLARVVPNSEGIKTDFSIGKV